MINQQFDDTHNVLVRTVTGALTSSDIHHAVLDWRQDSAFDPSIPVLWDMRGTTFDSTITQVLRTRQRMAQLPASKRRQGRTAWLVDSEETGTLLTRISSLAEWDTQWELFDNEAAALEWLTTSEAGAA